MLIDINNKRNTLVCCEYWVTKVLARKLWKTSARVSEDHSELAAKIKTQTDMEDGAWLLTN